MDRKELLGSLKTAKACLSTQDIVPILSHFCFDGKHITAFNGTQGIVLDFESDLKCALPGELLVKLLNSYSAKDLSFTPEDNNVLIKAGKSKVNLAALPEEDFLFEIPNTKKLPSFEITDDFLNGIKKCLFSVGKNVLQRNQFGVTLTEDENGAKLYSTDNHRISRYELAEATGTENNLLLPEAFCSMLINIGKDAGSGEFFIGSDFVVAIFDGVMVYSKLMVDVDYLDFEGAINASIDGYPEYQEPPKGLEAAFNRCLLFATKDQDPIVRLVSDDETLVITSESGLGNVDEEVDFYEYLDSVNGRFDVRLLLDALAVLDKVNISVASDGTHTFVGESDSFFHLILSFPEAE